MSGRPHERRGTAAERAYRLLLRAYPADFRAAYGHEMVLALRALRREPHAHGIRFWGAMIWDVARSAPGLRAESLRARRRRDIHLSEGTMKSMAILTILIGLLQAANALAEGWAGRAGPGGTSEVIAVGVVAIAGALLVAAGVALLRRAPNAGAWGRGAALVCLAAMVLVRLVHPWMSILSLVLGIGFPVALLLFLRTPRGSGPSAPMRA